MACDSPTKHAHLPLHSMQQHYWRTSERNQMNIVIYTKAQCPNCVSAKQLLKSKGLEYAEINVEHVPDALTMLQAQHPAARQMPQIFINGQRVGGLAGLQAALKQVGL